MGQSLPSYPNDVSRAVSFGFTARGESAGTIRWRRPNATSDLLDTTIAIMSIPSPARYWSSALQKMPSMH